jgi:hypothetical protein
MTRLNDIEHVLRCELLNPSSSFSIGCFGAIAEFHRSADEALTDFAPDRLTVATARGALRIDLKASIIALAYETLSGRPGRWQHGVVFCLPQSDAAKNARSALTELGPDNHAIHVQNEQDVLFDMGVAAQNIDFCIRTSSPELLQVLRANLGRSIFDADNPTMAAILDANPHRIVLSALGRCEVYQAIGRELTPEGPHTHVLPKLLAGGLAQSTNIPLPDEHLPCLNLYPANPFFDGLGRETSYDPEAQVAFEKLAQMWARPDHQAEKVQVRAAINAGMPPNKYPPPATRLRRRALRIALRQLSAAHPQSSRIDLKPWLAIFDREAVDGDDARIT